MSDTAFMYLQVRQLSNPRGVYIQLMEMLARLAGLGLVHCDYNEFNLLVCLGHLLPAVGWACVPSILTGALGYTLLPACLLVPAYASPYCLALPHPGERGGGNYLD